MKKAAFVGLVAVVLGVATRDVQAKQLSTTFNFSMRVGDVKTDLQPTPEGMRITLPAVFDRWNCQVTAAYLSKDGTNIYHTIVCKNVDTALVVGTGASCNRNNEDTDSGDFFMRTGDANIEFLALCRTR